MNIKWTGKSLDRHRRWMFQSLENERRNAPSMSTFWDYGIEINTDLKWRDRYGLAYSKNPCPCGNHTFPNKVHLWDLGSMRPQVMFFPGSDDALNWEMCNFCMGMGSCFYFMTCKKHQSSHAEIAYFHTLLVCMNCVLDDKQVEPYWRRATRSQVD